MKNAIKIFSYKGVPIYLKYWFLILPLFLPPLLIFYLLVGVLVHELSHSLQAKKLGYKTDYIFIDALYAGALIDPKFTLNNKNAIKIILAGPLSNIILSVVAFILSTIITAIFGDINIVNHLLDFVIINLILGIGNLIPIYPLDGGRISKSILNMFYGRKKSRRINVIISIIMIISLIIFSIMLNYWLLLVFCILFLISSYFEWNKKQ